MATTHASRKGSLQFWPRSRAKRQHPRISNFPQSKEANLLGFAGYKVGMTHLTYIDNRAKSQTKGEEIMHAATVIECPPLRIASVRFYKNRPAYGPVVVSEVRSPKMEKELARVLNMSKKATKKVEDIAADSYDYVRVLVYTQPKKSGLGKKTPELFELAVGGSKDDQVNFAKENLDKEIPLSSVLKAGQLVDMHAVTKGKGFQGPVKRFGLSLKNHKSEKKIRAPGNLGPWHPAKISFRVPQAGQMGYQVRPDYNKQIMLVSSEVDKINPKGGFIRYGNVKSEYLVIKGSVPGPSKRLVRFNHAIRPTRGIPTDEPTIEFISLESKQ